MQRSSLTDALKVAELEQTTRRRFIQNCTTGLGGLWMAQQMKANVASGTEAGSISPPTKHPGLGQFPAKAKRVIFLHMDGAPSQLELFDYKPKLAEFNGKECPQEYLEGQRFAFIQGTPRLLGPIFPFQQYGQSGAWVSDRFPNMAKHVDDMCFIKTMQTDQFNHGPAQLMVHSGNARVGYPSVGSWVTWGLGSANQDLPGFMVLLSGGRFPRVGSSLWSSGFLPSVYQGVQCQSKGDPILNITNPKDVTRDIRRSMLDALGELNQKSHEEYGDPETLTRIAQYEMAFRMQTAAPEVADISKESKETLELYGAQVGKESYANNCLLARRLAEAGVRYIQLFDWGWDSHGSARNEGLKEGFVDKCKDVDQGTAALLTDLKQRGMLEDTLVVWSGEFGRTSMQENRGGTTMQFLGRDHNPSAFTLWMAGGGVRTGMAYGETDDFGYRPAANPVHLRDFHATMLRLLGIDYQQYSYFFQGLNQKLTGVKPARVIEEIIA